MPAVLGIYIQTYNESKEEWYKDDPDNPTLGMIMPAVLIVEELKKNSPNHCYYSRKT